MTASFVVETERLRLREFTADDARAMFEIGSDPLVQRFTGDPCLNSVAEAREVILNFPLEDYRKHGYGRWAMELKETGQLIGMAGLKYLPEWEFVDVGYRLRPEYWGRGLATEASRASIQYGFERLKVSQIFGLVDPENIGSVRVLEKCGLKFEDYVEINAKCVARYSIRKPP